MNCEELKDELLSHLAMMESVLTLALTADDLNHALPSLEVLQRQMEIMRSALVRQTAD